MRQVEKYAERMDLMVEEALRLNVKWSLQELSRAISSDGKTTVNPLFKVKVLLTSKVRENFGSQCITSLPLPPATYHTPKKSLFIVQIEFSPTVEEIVGFVVSVPATLTTTISNIKRLPERLKLGGKRKPLV